jgi:antitoxin (DNA-binding transcriptional repressor) of toxin-antitoxin stability system
MVRIGAAKFKQQCLSILDDLEAEGVVVTKHGRPVALVTPYPRTCSDLIGALRDKIAIHGDILSTGEKWDADGQP